MVGLKFLVLAFIFERVCPCAIIYDETIRGSVSLRPFLDNPPNKNAEDYESRLQGARKVMSEKNLSAFIIFMDDFGRLSWVSGFTGSAGHAVITMKKALLWTDGRYFLQATHQLSKNWTLMKSGDFGVPDVQEWLSKFEDSGLKNGSIVGTDPRFIDAQSFLGMKLSLERVGIQLVSTWKNVIKMNENVTNFITDYIIPHPVVYAGKSWQDKMKELRTEIKKIGVDYLVVTELDEIAWLFNLRGDLIKNHYKLIQSPTFKGLSIIGCNEIFLWIHLSTLTEGAFNQLNPSKCPLKNSCIKMGELDNVFHDFKEIQETWKEKKKISLTKKSVFQSGGSYAIFESFGNQSIQFNESPIIMMKAVKNEAEVNAMISSSLDDSASLAEFFSFVENEIHQGKFVSEISASQKLEEIRQRNPNYKGPSFSTISAYGPHGSIIHYNPKPETDVQIKNQIDSGGQYSTGCTTDVTRTFHYGVPTAEEISMYTRVMMGAIDLAMLEIPVGSFDVNIDVVARQHLFAKGLNYKHNTGHGIGAFLEVHENPISLGFGRTTNPGKLLPNMFFSDEPGFYKDNQFGIRLETILRTVLKNIRVEKYGSFIYFEPVSLVPFEPHLIDYNLLSEKQIDWLNKYNRNIRIKVGSLLKEFNLTQAYKWILKRTNYLSMERLSN